MATYLILNIAVLTAVLIVLGRTPHKPSQAWFVTLGVLVVLTLIFDNALIWLGIYAYEPDTILGIYLLRAPIEDFMYPLLAVILIPAVWNRMGSPHAQ